MTVVATWNLVVFSSKLSAEVGQPWQLRVLNVFCMLMANLSTSAAVIAQMLLCSLVSLIHILPSRYHFEAIGTACSSEPRPILSQFKDRCVVDSPHSMALFFQLLLCAEGMGTAGLGAGAVGIEALITCWPLTSVI